jgi:SAM-dependent methyltransferase
LTHVTPHALRELLTWTITIALIVAMVRQCRKPAGWPGRAIVWIMNRSHSGLTDWGLAHLRIAPDFTILDVGCGGGRTIQKLAAASQGRVYGIDYSAASVAEAQRTNARDVAAGRVDIRLGSVSSLPFGDGTFDLVTAVETHYYWPDLVSDLREILRVLKPGGRVAIVAESYRSSRFGAAYLPAMTLLGGRFLTDGEHRDALAAAGCSEVAIEVKAKAGWICAIGRKGHDRA